MVSKADLVSWTRGVGGFAVATAAAVGRQACCSDAGISKAT